MIDRWQFIEIIVALVFVVAVGSAIGYGISIGQEWAEIDAKAAQLEKENEHLRIMIEDLHMIVPLMEHKIVKLETEMTPRELIWHLQEQFADCALVEVH